MSLLLYDSFQQRQITTEEILESINELGDSHKFLSFSID